MPGKVIVKRGIELCDDKTTAALNKPEVKEALLIIKDVFEEIFTKDHVERLTKAKEVLANVLISNCLKVDEIENPKLISESYFMYDRNAKTENKLTLIEFAMIHNFCIRTNMFGVNDILFSNDQKMDILSKIIEISKMYEEEKMDRKIIVKYVRDKKDHSPIGCVVGIDREKLGCCYVNKADRPKSKKEMLELALKRAEDNKFVTDMDSNADNPEKMWKVPGCMRTIYSEMLDRSRRYFKENDAKGDNE